ncbi:hypothetical protein [Streptobacillus moniliformis]|uniref:hypothetical protein n=1 Tax=Streptobacillus moniliformis TaxID=34105 RepID=UPI0007E3687E|nr:hypothetical protein [Streptobacillus moniliformis]
MLKAFKDIQRVILKDKEYMRDDLIDKFFVMDHLECSETKALKLIVEINRQGELKYKKDSKVFGQGKTSLMWYWQHKGLKGEFV